jgi:hypothetical protein
VTPTATLAAITEVCRRAGAHAAEAERIASERYRCTLPDGSACPPINETKGCVGCPHRERIEA